MSIYKLSQTDGTLDEYRIVGFPMPDTVNNGLIISRKGRLTKSAGQRAFFSSVDLFAYRHARALTQIRHELKTLIESGYTLGVDCYFAFPHDKLFYKRKGTPSRMDANNRLKPTLDGLAKCLTIDDAYFFAGNCEKVVTDGEASVSITIRAHCVQRLADLDFELGKLKPL